MILESILTAIFVGWLLRGKFMRLADVRIRYFWMVFVPLGLHFAAYGINYAHVFGPNHWVFGVVRLTEFLVLCIVAVANRSIPGVKLMFAGLAVNLVVMAVNGGYMPVAVDAIRSSYGEAGLAQMKHAVGHSFIGAGTKLAFLCDTIAAKRLYLPIPSVYSIGDLITSFGMLIAIIAIMRNPKYSERLTPQGA